MSGAQSVLIASGGVGGMLLLLLWVRRPWVQPRHAAPSGRLDLGPLHLDAYDAPGFLPAPAAVTGCACGVQSGEHKLWCVTADAAPGWAARSEMPAPVERTDGGGAEPGEWFEHTLHELAPDGLVGPPTRRLIEDLSREEGAADGAAPGSPRAVPGGAGDESEPSGVTAPPAPPCCDDPYGTHAVEAWAAGGFKVTWDGQPEPARRASAVDVALAQMDAFMVGMRADHAQWMASARERWAAA